MTADPERRFRQVLDDYAALEPGSTDTWNPLLRDVELEHRLVLLRQLVEALRVSHQNHQELQVLDVGCGNGRSTRVYLDLGLRPEQLTGVDLRSGALTLAEALHPTIRWLLVDDAPWPLDTDSVSWVSLCTVFSSIRAADDRQHLAAEITRVLAPGGHLFFWDKTRALDFAGGDALVPGEWFEGLTTLWHGPAEVKGYDAPSPTHGAWLLRRP